MGSIVSYWKSEKEDVPVETSPLLSRIETHPFLLSPEFMDMQERASAYECKLDISENNFVISHVSLYKDSSISLRIDIDDSEDQQLLIRTFHGFMNKLCMQLPEI